MITSFLICEIVTILIFVYLLLSCNYCLFHINCYTVLFFSLLCQTLSIIFVGHFCQLYLTMANYYRDCTVNFRAHISNLGQVIQKSVRLNIFYLIYSKLVFRLGIWLLFLTKSKIDSTVRILFSKLPTDISANTLVHSSWKVSRYNVG